MTEYARRNHMAMGAAYVKHVEAMTAEGLHAKSAIAGELAWRDLEIERLREALTPSGSTKAAFIGEFSFYKSTFDEDILISVPWTTIKEIMAAIKARAEMSSFATEKADEENN